MSYAHAVASPATSAIPPVVSQVRRVHALAINEARRMIGNSIVIGAVDAIALAMALGAGWWFRLLVFGHPVLPAWTWWIIPAWWIAAVPSGLLPGWGLSSAEHLRRQVLLLTSLVGLGTAVLFFAKTSKDFSRVSVAVSWVCGLAFVPLGRVLARSLLVRRGSYGVPAVLYGRSDAVASVIDHMSLEGGLGYKPVGVCTPDPETSVQGLPVCGDLHHPQPVAPVAIVVTRGLYASEVQPLINRTLKLHAHVVILPDLRDLPTVWVSPRDVSGLLGLQVRQFVLNPVALMTKRAIDVTVVLLSSALWAPLFAVVATLIWLEDRATPFHRQIRIGCAGRRFEAFKFRTMVVNAEATLKEMLARDAALRAEWEANFKLRKDPRITRVGRFLRRTSLDELPQLINVLRGEMSLVGPRPLPEYHHFELPEDVQEVRMRTLPGMTGLWQVSGRSDAGNSGMVRWDPYYVRNWSLWLDAVILVRTIRTVVLGSGAY